MTLVPPRSIRGSSHETASSSSRSGLPRSAQTFAKTFARLGPLAARKAGPAGLDDARLFEGYLFDAVAEPLGVLELDRRDDAGRRIDDVGRIEAPARPVSITAASQPARRKAQKAIKVPSSK